VGHAEAVLPVLFGHPGSVDFAAPNLERLAVEQEIIGADREGVARLG
jgi:hypothetical protein